MVASRRKVSSLWHFACWIGSKADPHEVYAKELKIIASRINPFTFNSSMQILQDMGERYLSFEKLGMRTFQLQEFTAALEVQRSGEISKAVFEN